MGVSNYLTSILNFLSMLVAIGVIGAGVWLMQRHDTTVCIRFLQIPIIALGIFIFLVSLAGFLGSCLRVSWLLWIYLSVMLILILVLLAFSIFSFLITNKGAGHILSGRGYKEYRLGDYSHWLQKCVDYSSNWVKIRSCLIEAKVCMNLDSRFPTQEAFSAADLSPVQSGCCKPPSACMFTFESPTRWINPMSPGSDADCYRWSQQGLCLDCDSCRAGVLQNIKEEWRKVMYVNVLVFVFLVFVYSVGCCAFRNARKDEAYHRRRQLSLKPPGT